MACIPYDSVVRCWQRQLQLWQWRSVLIASYGSQLVDIFAWCGYPLDCTGSKVRNLEQLIGLVFINFWHVTHAQLPEDGRITVVIVAN